MIIVAGIVLIYLFIGASFAALVEAVVPEPMRARKKVVKDFLSITFAWPFLFMLRP